VDLPDTRQGAVERLAGELEANYTIPPIGKQYATALRAHLAQGDYDKPTDTAALARQLTADLQAVHPDRHVRVTLDGEGPGAPPHAGGPPREVLKGVEEARWIEPGIAYIRFSLFSGSPEEVAEVQAFMTEHLSAKAIIIDARGHHGGGLAEMNVMLPYLYARKTVLVDMDVSEAVEARMGGPPGGDDGLVRIKAPAGLVRREHVVTPNATEHRLFTAKVFYLTSLRTGSAAEHLALAFKRTHRATLVGEHTAGANHFGGDEPLGAGLSAFIPVGRTFDPDTGEDWEGRGVLPDVAVPADQALDVALKLARA
jgi:C-terminal processing protease CtpA/Prc